MPSDDYVLDEQNAKSGNTTCFLLYINKSSELGSFVLAMELAQDKERFRIFQRMIKDSFNLLAGLVVHEINKALTDLKKKKPRAVNKGLYLR